MVDREDGSRGGLRIGFGSSYRAAVACAACGWTLAEDEARVRKERTPSRTTDAAGETTSLLTGGGGDKSV